MRFHIFSKKRGVPLTFFCMAIHFFEIFDQIKPSEQDRFAQYLYSQHGADEQIVRIFKYISPLVKQGEKVNEAEAFQHIFGTAPNLAMPHAMRPLHNLFHDLKKELLDFFAWQEYRKNKSRGPALLLRLEALKKKGISALYTEQVQHCRKKEEKDKHPVSVWDYLEDVLVEDHHLYNTLSDPWDEEAEQSLDAMIANLDQFYAAAAWKYRLERLHQIRIHGNAHRQSAQDMDALYNLTERLPQPGQPLGLYRDLYKMVSDQDADLCQQIQEKYPLKKLAPEEQFILTTTLINFKYRLRKGTIFSGKKSGLVL